MDWLRFLERRNFIQVSSDYKLALFIPDGYSKRRLQDYYEIIWIFLLIILQLLRHVVKQV